MRARQVLAVAVAVLAVAACGGDDDDGGAGDVAGIEGVEIIRIGPYDHHDGPFDYDRFPPAGGDHPSGAAQCGLYDEAIPDQFAVHSLEHGAIWIAFRPSLAGDEIDVIRDLTGEHKVVATPYPDLDDPVVVTAWGAQLALDSPRDERLVAFIDAFTDASSAPEAGLGC